MSVNKYLPHILVLPEDRANEQLVNGFLLDPSLDANSIQVLRPVGGWSRVIEKFEQTHIAEMNRYPLRHMILLVDFDQVHDRLAKVQDSIPDYLKDRVFVLGVWSQPENLRALLQKKYEEIGITLAEECQSESLTTWNHDLLKHNSGELIRMNAIIKPILFPEI